MVLGLSLAAFTQLHTIISLVAIATGLIALIAFARGSWLGSIMQIFVWTTVATTATGFLFPFNGFTPAIGKVMASAAPLKSALATMGRDAASTRTQLPRIVRHIGHCSLWRVATVPVDKRTASPLAPLG